MPTHDLKITTPMVCGGCANTVYNALMSVPGVCSVSVSPTAQLAKIETTSDELACTCQKTSSGACPCGENCTCASKKMIQAVTEAGFASETTTDTAFPCGVSDIVGSSTGAATTTSSAPCGAKNCNCGENCQCGSNCQCAGCPGKSCGSVVGNNSGGKCKSLLCTCGPNCRCGTNCNCSSCMTVDFGIKVGLGVALAAGAWMIFSKSRRF